ncbi:MAG: flagellar basal body rod protein FlgF [Gammaproteobacteria bacterium]|nr:flagellar basal body rod protein FlgF [Gammaproteobacteria bacterium]
MDRLIYVAMTGAREAMRAQSLVAHNIANAGTTGFRAVRHSVEAQAVQGPGLATRINPVTLPDTWNAASGTMIQTGRELDIAIQGDGWIAVQDTDGSEAYTRAGSLRINAAGMLETAGGQLVKGSGGPVSIPDFSELYIGNDGQISVVPKGQTPESLAVVERIKLVDPPQAQMIAAGNGLYRMADGSEAAADATVTIASGQLESSNVNATAALVEMIEVARAYDMQVRVMHSADENAAAAARLIRTGG